MSWSWINSRGAGVSSQLPLARGGGRLSPPSPCLTSELISGARSARRRSKALNQGILKQSQTFLSMVKFRFKVRSKVKADYFRLIGCRDETRDSCRRKLCENATGWMTKMPCKQETNAEYSSRSGQMGSPYENIARVSCDTWFMGHLGRRIRW